MSICKQRKESKEKVCIGALSKRITIKIRSIIPPQNSGVDYSEEFESLRKVWAHIETSKGETLFDKSNVERVVTHNVYIRYIADITFENWIKYKNEYFRILDVTNLNEQNQFYLLRCTNRGDIGKPSNFI